jgi:hypothetical protein
MTKWHGGKGSIQKPYDKDKFDENFDRIFLKDKDTKKEKTKKEKKNG